VVEVEVKSEARGDKGAVVHLIGPGRGAPRLTSPAPDLETRMRVLARSEGVDSGSGARRAADAAQDEAIEPLFSLPGGGQIAVEPTRALTAVDVDMAAAHGPAGKAMVKAVNLAAIREAARVLRLKGLGGLVVIDFVGRGHDGPALLAAARSAFAPDNPGVAIGPVSRFGLMELAIPRRARPVVDILRGGRPGLGPATVAMNLLRALERQAMADPGGRFEVATAPDIAEAAGKGFEALIAKLGARIALRPEQDRVEFEIRRS
jgi:Ribonuclease G/E